MRIFKKAGVEQLLGTALEAVGAGEIASQVVPKVGDVVSKATGTDQGTQDLVKNNMDAFNSLANQLHVMLSAAGIPESQMPQEFIDPEQLFNYFNGNYSVDAKNDLNDILSALTQFFQVLPETFFNSDQNLIKEILDFTFKYYKRNNYNKQAVITKLDEYKDQMASGDPFQQLICIQQIQGNFLGASIMSILNLIGKDNPDVKDFYKISNAAQKMLGSQSPELLNSQALTDAKNRTTFDQLKESKDLYKIMTPIAMQKENFKQEIYNTLDSALGTQAAKDIVNGPLGTFLILSYGFKEGVSGLLGGATSAMRGK